MSYGAILGQNNYVKRTGDAMTGPLVLPGDPTEDLQAATKQYVDTATTTASIFKQELLGSATLQSSQKQANISTPVKNYSSSIPVGICFELQFNNYIRTGIEMSFDLSIDNNSLTTLLTKGESSYALNSTVSLIYFYSNIEYTRYDNNLTGTLIGPSRSFSFGFGLTYTLWCQYSFNQGSVTFNIYAFY